jgi:type IV secretion system protein VirB6
MYEQFATYADQMTIAGMDNIIGAGIAWTTTFMRGALTIAVLVAAALCWFGRLNFWWVTRRIFIAVFVILLLQGGQYTSYIRTPFWETIPNGISSALAGSSVSITPAQRFDRISDAASTAISRVDRQITSIFEIRAQVSIALAQAAINAFIGICFCLWLISRIALALLIGVGPFLLVAAIFDISRHFLMEWFGKLVSLSVWSLCAMVLTEIVLQGSILWIQRTATADVGIAEAVDGLWKIAVWMLVCAVVMIGLPYYASIGSPASAGVNSGIGVGIAAARMGGGAAMSAAAGAAKMGRAAGTAAARQIRRLI